MMIVVIDVGSTFDTQLKTKQTFLFFFCGTLHPQDEIQWNCMPCTYFYKARTEHHKVEIYNLFKKKIDCDCQDYHCDNRIKTLRK